MDDRPKTIAPRSGTHSSRARSNPTLEVLDTLRFKSVQGLARVSRHHHDLHVGLGESFALLTKPFTSRDLQQKIAEGLAARVRVPPLKGDGGLPKP